MECKQAAVGEGTCRTRGKERREKKRREEKER